jgi:hypothetical protein
MPPSKAVIGELRLDHGTSVTGASGLGNAVQGGCLGNMSHPCDSLTAEA